MGTPPLIKHEGPVRPAAGTRPLPPAGAGVVAPALLRPTFGWVSLVETARARLVRRHQHRGATPKY